MSDNGKQKPDEGLRIIAQVCEDFLDHVIVICRLVMKQHKALDLRRLGELDRNDIARMTPILLDRDCVGE